MHIICPHCTTSYGINPATLGAGGRTVRCSRCKEVWVARPGDATELAVPAMAAASQQAEGDDAAAEWQALAREGEGGELETPVVDSPSISADWPAEGQGDGQGDGQGLSQSDWTAMAGDDARGTKRVKRPSRLSGLFQRPALLRGSGKPLVNLPIACAAMGALAVALMVWRVDVVRLLPQTASFYKMAGLDVNLRGLVFKDVKITTETVDGKPVLVIEGVIVGETRKPVELPRLRFSVRDAQGAEIYAWNAVLDQPMLKPGDKAWFKSRLASPPPEGRNINVRFFSKRDLAGA